MYRSLPEKVKTKCGNNAVKVKWWKVWGEILKILKVIRMSEWDQQAEIYVLGNGGRDIRVDRRMA